MRWQPKAQAAPKVVSSGSVSKPTVPAWRPKAQPAPKRVSPGPKPRLS